ncbi:peptidase S8/S53 domain-containing protein [Thamnidium elegans]|nr:peptidase S8/S53 domain-containing protein [Thamnidium elegans]
MVQLTTIALLVATFGTFVQGKYMGKRDPNREYYTLKIPQEDGAKSAQHIAHELNARFEGSIGELDSWYMLSSPKSKKRQQEDAILSQFYRHKNLALNKREESPWHKVESIDKQVLKKRVKRGPIPPQDLFTDAQKSLGMGDPWFEKQWHLINQENPGNDINVTGVWKQGIAGKDVVVVILDDGLDYKSEDLKDNFYAEGSYDFNDHEYLPTPKLWDDSHGTRCAGQIAAVKNDVCGVGIAYESKVAGVRILSGELTDADEAIALNYEYQKNHIFSCSWGPPDNGRTMEAPNGILADAFYNGIKNGRDGKGSVYVFATGNGAVSGDNCNFDGYTNSIYTITVGAIDHTNEHPPYSESCSAQLVVTYSSGSGQFIHTTDVGTNACSNRHGGTSAAAPNAAGIFALVLSVRPDLSWRDLQHLCVQTAVPINIDDNDWKKLPSGRLYNHKFGYGKLDAYALVEAAKTFPLVNQQTWLELPSPQKKIAIPDSTGLKTRKALKNIVLVTDDMVKAAGLLRLEHITATVNIEHERRGSIVIDLESPNHVKSELATRRMLDDDASGIKDWKFMSVKHWEEDPVGNWTLHVYDVDNPKTSGFMLNWTLTLFGEQDPDFVGTPVHVSTGVHDDEELEVPVTTTTTQTTVSDDTPSRPTPNKSKSKSKSKSTSTTTTTTSSTDTTVTTTKSSSTTTATTATTTTTTTTDDTAGDDSTNNKETSATSIESDQMNNIEEEKAKESSNDGYLTIIYSVVGSIAILAVASVLYINKKNGWRSPSEGITSTSDRRPDGYEFDVLQPLTEFDEEEDESDDEVDRNRNNNH